MEFKQFSIQLAALADYYNHKMTKATVGIYWSCLKNQDPEVLQGVLQEVPLKFKWMPKVSEILEKIEEKAPPQINRTGMYRIVEKDVNLFIHSPVKISQKIKDELTPELETLGLEMRNKGMSEGEVKESFIRTINARIKTEKQGFTDVGTILGNELERI